MTRKQLIEQIKQTSYIAKDDKEFTSAESIAILGSPDKWQPSEEELPMDLKDIKNEFWGLIEKFSFWLF